MLKRFYLLTLFSLAVFSCSEESNPVFDTENFTSIFDNNKFDIDYTPVDMVQTSDGGYIVLGSRKLIDSEFSGIYLLQADKNGNFIKEKEVDKAYVNPVARFTKIGDAYYFFCMEEASLIANIASVDVNNIENVTFTAVTTAGINPTYPSVSSFVDNKFLLQ